jgi:alpha-1,3-rhamnosyl/mannosyltransferase
VIVAYDLRYAADDFSGIATQAHGLLAALLDTPGDERYAVLWNPHLEQTRFDLERIRRHPRVRWHERGIPPVRPSTAWRTGAWLRALRPHIYLSPFHVLPWVAGCPRVLTVHDVRPLRMRSGLSWPRQLAAQFALHEAARAERILTVSRFSRDELLALTRADPARVRVVHNGQPEVPAGTRPTRPAGLGARPFALVVGENRPHKNLDVLARAWATFRGGPPLDLVGAGAVDRRYPDLGALAARHGARGVIALGRVSEGEREWLYAHASVLVLPSTYEGFGFPLLEAMRHGTPVVAACIPALREVGDEAARYCDPHDADAWAAAVLELAADGPVRERLRAAGPERARAFSFARAARETLAELRELTGARA